MIRRLVALAAITAAGVLAAVAQGDVSHVGWPHTVTTWFAWNAGGTGIGTNGNDMLLGAGGSDQIFGGPGADVIWGDRYPSPNGPGQTDVLHGGPGDDWIYTSHGTNHIGAGSGDDHVFAYFGTGTIDCGAGTDTLTVSKSARPRYSIENCEIVRVGKP
jgi:hypothetical protein